MSRENEICFLLLLLLLLPLGAFRVTRSSSPSLGSRILKMTSEKQEMLRDALIKLCTKPPDNIINRPQIVELIEELARLYPCTSNPLQNWRYRIDMEQSDEDAYRPPSLYDGIWSTRFMSKDQSSSELPRQMVNSTSSEVKYVVECSKGKLFKINGYDVIYKLQALSDNKFKLCSKKITLYRKSRVGLSAISLRFLIDFILNRLNHTNDSILEIVYMDDEMCIEKNEKRDYYIKTRLYEAWNPLNPKGWELISCL